ncbi:PucR family transcriptional regulator [Moorella sulfitireducens]|uniref:PucR family transcriptional regulator n=1 Tax=Neomoorella sulfitireducens TaxID=2972948 RepID=UPI0021AC51F2|nr:helix-turn-helix domain-containing protein [Moorella sulfitireducens]
MVILYQILDYVSSKLNSTITGNAKRCQPIYRVKCWNGEDTDDNGTLYLAYSEQMPLVHQKNSPFLFVGCLSNKHTDGTFCLCADIQLDELKLMIEDFMNLNTDLAEYQRQLFSLLYFGGEIKTFLLLAGEKLSNPILVLDASYRVISTTPNIDFASNSILTEDYEQLHPEVLKFMHQCHLLETIYSSTKAFIFPVPDSTARWILCPIKIYATSVGFVWVLEQHRRFEEGDLEVVEILAQAISIEMQKDQFFKGKTGLKYESFIADLLENRINSREVLDKRLAQLNRNFHKYFRIMVLYLDDTQINNITQIMQILRDMLSNSMIIYHKDAIVLLFEEKDAYVDPQLQARTREFLKPSRFYGGVSNCFTDLLSTHIYYKQAMALANYAKLARTEENILLFDDVVIPFLFADKSASELESFVCPPIKLLSQYDKKHNTEYLLTLKTYFDNNRSVKESIEALHIHRSTFFYRLGKIEEIINHSLSDGKLLFSMEYSFYILDCINQKNRFNDSGAKTPQKPHNKKIKQQE